MLRRTLMKLAFVAIAATQMLSVAPAPVGAYAGTQTYVSPTYGYSLTYDAAWRVVGEASVPRGDWIQLTNETSYILLVGTTEFGGDAEDCVAGAFGQYMSNATYSDFAAATDAEGNDMADGDAANAYAVYDYTFTTKDGTQEAMTLDIQCVSLTSGDAALAIVHDVPDAAYDSEMAAWNRLLQGLTLPEEEPTTGVKSTGEALDKSAIVTSISAVGADLDAFAGPGKVSFAKTAETDVADLEAFSSEQFNSIGDYCTQLFDATVEGPAEPPISPGVGSEACDHSQTITL